MTVASENEFPKVIMEEVATDGSATVTPAADHRALFLGEDGQLHVKDSAGAVTDIGGAVADILDLPTAETDDTLVLAPDGVGGVEFRAESGGGGGSLPAAKIWVSDNFDARDYPSSPDATYDDEFDDGTGMSGTVNGLDARWNWRNQGGATVTFGKSGWGTLNCPAQSGNNFRIIEIAAFADGTYEASVSVEYPIDVASGGGVYGFGGLALIDNTNGDFYICGRLRDSENEYLAVQAWSNVTSWSANVALIAGTPGPTRTFLRVTKASTALAFWLSDDGIGWHRFFAWTDSIGADRIGFAVNESMNKGLTKLHIDYFRKTA